MANIALGIVGAGIGAAIGGPQGAALGWSVGVTLAGVVFPPKLDAQQRGRIDDLRVTGSGYGAVIPKVWGKSRLAGNIIWATDLIQRKRDDEVGGKGAPSQQVTTYSYFGCFAVAICAGPISEILKIWAEDVLIYDSTESPETKYDITIYLGDETQTPDPLIESFEGVGEVPAYRGTAYVVFNMLPLRKWGNRLPSITFEVSTGAETLATVLGDLFSEVGLDAAQYDVTDVDAIDIEGFVIQSRTSVSSAVEPLLRAYQADLTEFDGKVYGIARGGAVDMTIDADDLGADFWGNQGDNPPSLVDVKRIQDIELPASVELTYFDVDKNYQTGSQFAVRFTKAHVDNKLTVTLPISTDHTTARRMAETLLYQQWTEREQPRIVLPPAYLSLVPTSVLNVPIAGSTVRCRVVGVDVSLFGPLEVQLVKDDAAILSQVVSGGDLGTVTDELSNPETVAFIPFCCNALQDDHADSPGFYLAAAGQEGWGGVAVYRRRQGNAFQKFGEITDSATYGEASSVLAAGTSTGTFDNTHTVDIEILAGSIETTSIDEVLSGANVALLGDEVIQFTTVTALGGGIYRLSGLLRGQRGTDYAWGTHAIGDRFIVLTPGTIIRADVDRGLIGKSVDFKAITEDQQLADVSPVSLTITGQELKPYAPVHIEGERDGSDNLNITWIRRARKDAEWQDLGDIDLDEEAERYKVEVWDSTYTTLKRTISGLTSPAATYSAAQQTTDFGSPQAQVYVKVYQLGDFKSGTTTSRQDGYPGIATV